MKKLSKTVPILLLVALLMAACGPMATPGPGSAGMPNPASENCVEKGGTLSIEKRGSVWTIHQRDKKLPPFLDVSVEVLDQTQAGLYSPVLDPHFETNDWVRPE